MPEITDEYMNARLAESRQYALVLLRKGENYTMEDGRDAIVWEHGRRNLALRSDGTMALVGPVYGDSDVVGMCVLASTVDEAREVIAGDPAVQAGIFTYEVQPWHSFPGDALPA
jgi:hypothetical protein